MAPQIASSRNAGRPSTRRPGGPTPARSRNILGDLELGHREAGKFGDNPNRYVGARSVSPELRGRGGLL